MNIYTYFIPIPGKSDNEEMALIRLWQESWRLQGWNPIILSEENLPKDKAFASMLRKFRRKPTTMKPGLSYSWFCRWLAVAEQGGGFMCDYDVINYSFQPNEFKNLTIYSGAVPCLVSGSKDEFLRMCKIFAEYRFDWKDRVGWWFDTSDMKIIMKRPGTYIPKFDCIEHGQPNWETAPTVHYSNFAMKPKGYMPRHEWIPKLRSLGKI